MKLKSQNKLAKTKEIAKKCLSDLFYQFRKLIFEFPFISFTVEKPVPETFGKAQYRFITDRFQRSYYRTARRLLRLKPVLSYLEIHLVDHCNLNCRGCSHCSPLADEFFADIEQHELDIKRLKQLIPDVREIRLLGGEPLLHPKVTNFFDVTRAYFPKSKIYMTTNGILLPKMPETFWESCRLNSISIAVTLYPPFHEKESDLMKLAKKERTTMSVVKNSRFLITTNSKGNSDKEKNFRRCQKWVYCPILVHGKIYRCSRPPYWRFFNKAFGTNVPNTGYADIYDPKMTGWKILSSIDKSSEACRYCTLALENTTTTHAWAISECRREEWDVAIQQH